MTLRDWRCFRTEDWARPSVSPQVGAQLEGRVYGRTTPIDDRPAEDGMRVWTTPIVKIEGHTVTTESGSRYTLGKPSADYVAWLVGRGDTPGLEFAMQKPTT